MTTLEILAHLRQHGARVWLDGEKVRYRGPKSLFTASLRSELKAREEEIREFLSVARTSRDEERIPRRVEAQPVRLSSGQERLWFLHQLQPDSPVYNVPLAVRVRGPFVVEKMAEALSGVARRHEALRAVFPVDSEGRPSVRVLPPSPLPLPVIDVRALPPDRRLGEAEARLEELVRRPFDLARGPLWRALVVRLGDEEHILSSSQHHIVVDGWSLGVMLREIAGLYKRRESLLPPLPIGYFDYASWQRSRLEGEALASQLRFWRETLDGATGELGLPTDRPRGSDLELGGSKVQVSLDGATVSGLRALGQEHGATLFMTLLTIFKILLRRLGAGEDLCVGSPVANRSRAELEPLIGFFVNTVVLRSHLPAEDSGGAALARVRESCVSAFAQQELPFERLVEALQPDRGLARTPLFEALFVLQNLPQEGFEVGDIYLEPLILETGTAKFDLTLSLLEVGEGVEGTLEFRGSIFDATTAKRWSEHWSSLAASLLADPTRPIADLSLLSRAETWQLVGEWGAARWTGESMGPTLWGLFLRQARREPGRTAVRYGETVLSYGELLRYSEELARRLLALGTGPETLVGLWAERNAELLVGILAILRSGAGYLPLDPAVPMERRKYMLADAGAHAVLGPGEELDEPAKALKIPRLSLGPLEQVQDTRGPSDEGNGVSDLATAYVMYTSGSTGRPKGVAISHRQVARLFTHTRDWLRPAADDVWSLFHSPAFDFSVWEIWGALLHGGTLVVVPVEVGRDPARFRRLLAEEGVTILNQTPSAFRQLIVADREEPTPLEGLRLVIFGGEALSFPSLAPWIQRYGDERPALVNMYGITETTVHVTYRRVRDHDIESSAASGIGRPIPDLGLWALDHRLRPVPIGVPGELVVGGAGLASRYWNRPALTAQKFVPDPFSGLPGQRLYRSGDLGRFLATGELEYLGRIDHQVKIRGFRIELGEIRARLSQMPEVAAAVVVPWRQRESQRLVAYLVPASPGALPAREELRQRLEQTLPEYMIPARFLPLEEIPLTVNGKVDVRALPSPSQGGVEARRRFEPPSGEVEVGLAKVLSQVLGIDEVGRHDNIFDLGCDSITCVQVVAQARHEGIGLELQELFLHQTVAALAALVAGRETATKPREVGAFELVPESIREQLGDEVEDAYPLARLQAGMFFHDAFRLEERVYQNVHQLTLAGDLEPAALERAVEDLATRHPILRTSFELVGFDPPLQVVHGRVQIPFVLQDLRHLEARERTARVDAIFRKEGEVAFQPSVAPLIRFHLLRVEDRRWVLGWAFHHALLDGWSLATLLTELFSDYLRQAQGSRELPLPPPATTFRDFLALELASLEDPAAREYFESLAGELPDRHLLYLPEAGQARGQGQVSTSIPSELGAGLERLAREAGVPLKTVLLTAHLRVVAMLLGERRGASGLLAHGRPETPDSDRTLGLFVNALPLVASFPAGSWRELVAMTFATETELLRHRRYPFASLQGAAGSSGAMEILFNYLNFHVLDAVERLPGLRLVDLRNSGRTSVTLAATFRRDSTGGLTLLLEYLRERLCAARVKTYSALYFSALEALARRPDSSHGAAWVPSRVLGEIPLWSDSAKLPDGSEDLLGPWLRRVREAPEAVAVVDGERVVSYGKLASLVHATADHLRGNLKPSSPEPGEVIEPVVGFHGGPSLELVVTLLATLEAGAVFVALDPAHPSGRITELIRQSRLRFWIAPEGGAEPEVDEVTGFSLGLERNGVRWNGAESPSRHDRAIESGSRTYSEGAAYLLFTSGTTGPPKGVVVARGELARHLRGARSAYRLSSADRVAQLASPGFDVAIEQMLATLWSGACLVLREKRVPTGGELEDWVNRQRLSVVNLSPALFSPWATARESPGEAGLRLVIVGGDEFRPTDLQRWCRADPDARITVVNAYGPTESVITATTGQVSGEQVPELGTLPLGRSLAGRQVRVLDRWGERVPPGVPGQLWLGGILARGYFGQPAMTAERFRPDPWHSIPGSRIYASGDRVVFNEAGRLEFLGRLDQQLKIRGQRVETGEIEAEIGALEGIRQVAVGLRPEEGAGRLVAYAVVAPGAERRSSQWIRQLRRRLPEALVPRVWIFLERMPTTVAGKIDRRALSRNPLPDVEPGVGATPANERERVLLEELETIFGRSDLSVETDFFALGGHSLLAARWVARIQDRLDVELPIEAVFESPNVAELGAYLERQGAKKRGLAVPTLERHASRGPTPLSFAQERIWFLQEVEPASTAYNVPVLLRLDGELDVAALEQALNDVVAHHEVLRTRFEVRNGRPVQVVEPRWALHLRRIDLTGLPDELANVRWQEAQEWLARPFDLGRLPLLRGMVGLLPGGAWLRLEMHHVIIDGWSMGILRRQLVAAYEARRQGRVAALLALEIQYREYAAWQRSSREGPEQVRSMEYWQRQLAGAPSRLELPFDRPGDGGGIRRAGHVRLSISSSLARAWMGLARRSRATRFMVGLAAFAAFLGRRAGCRDLVIGTATAGRDRPELEEMIGCFVHTVALRIRWSADASFRELVEETRRTVLDAFANPWPPFELLVDRLQVERAPESSPLFQTSFLLQERAASSRLDARGMALASAPALNRDAKLDLTLAFEGRLRGLEGMLEFDAGRWDQTTMIRWGRSLERWLREALARPDRPVSSLPLLSRSERHQILQEWIGPRRSGLSDRDLVRAEFRRQAEENPDRVVLRGGSDQLSAAGLAAMAARTARQLLALGLRREARVGILMPRSPEWVIAMLATLEANAVYVPLDPSAPPARLRSLLEDAQIEALWTRPLDDHRVPEGYIGACLEIASCEATVSTPIAPAGDCALPSAAAYQIYTSGSTGFPKGVVISHGALANHMRWMRSVRPLEPEDRVLFKTSPVFDASVWEIWAPLLAGATLVVAAPGHEGDPEALLGDVARERATVLQVVPSLLDLLLDLGDRESWGSLRIVYCGGEPLPRGLVSRIRDLGPKIEWINLYGPTEATIQVSWEVVTEVPVSASAPVGRPIDEARLRVLDNAGGLAGRGTIGELVISGPSLARGYHRRPGSTAASFVPDPWAERPGERMYRTGDLALQGADGRLEIVGRRDDQVKVRGVRAEPGEVRAVLAARSDLQEVAVVARRGPGGGELVAYVVPGREAPDLGELREWLAEQLPSALVPSRWMRLEKLPRLPSGKLDRGSLPEPSASPMEEASIQPRTELERQVTELWMEVLGLDDLGVEDSFFDVGGHSLLSVRLLGRIEEVLDRRVPLSHFLSAPTVAGMASYFETGAESGECWLVPMRDEPSVDQLEELFLVHPAGGQVSGYRHLVEELGPEVRALAFRSPGLEEGEAPVDSIPELARLYLEELEQRRLQGTVHLLGWSTGGSIAFEMARRLHISGTAATLTLVDCRSPDSKPPSPTGKSERSLLFLRHLAASTGSPFPWKGSSGLEGSVEDLWDSVLSAARDAGALDHDGSEPWLRRLEATFLAHVDAETSYSPASSGIPTLLLRARDQPSQDRDPTLGWGAWIPQLEVVSLPGDHYSLMRPPQVQGLAQRIRLWMKGVLRGLPGPKGRGS